MRKNNFITPRRESIFAIAFILLRFIRKVLWPLVAVYFFRSGDGWFGMSWLSPYFSALAALPILFSIAFYFTFYFSVSDKELLIKKGILGRTKLNIPFERIQTVNFHQNILHQIFGVVQVEIDTAGSKSKEFSIDALSLKDAEELRSLLLERKANLVGDQALDDFVESEANAAPEELLLHLKPADLLRVGVSENHFKTAGIVWGFLFATYWQIDQYLEVDQYVDGYIPETMNSWTSYLLVGVPVFIFGAILTSMVRAVIFHFDLKLFRTGDGLKKVAGLFNRKQQSIPNQKVQLIRYYSNPIKKLLGLFTVQLNQAASRSEDGKKQAAIVIPGCYEEQLNQILKQFIPENYWADQKGYEISKLYAIRRFLFIGLLPGIALIAALYSQLSWWSLLFGLWIPLQYYWSFRRRKKWKFAFNDELLRTGSGVVFKKHQLLQFFKVQAAEVIQSPYQRRKNVADLKIYTAGGSLRIPYMHEKDARDLRDFALYRVETDSRDWM